MKLNQLITRLQDIQTEANQDLDVIVRYYKSPRKREARRILNACPGRIEIGNKEYVELWGENIPI